MRDLPTEGNRHRAHPDRSIMSDWILAALSLLGYEAVAMVLARVLYRHVMWDNLNTHRVHVGFGREENRYRYEKARHAGKSWWLAQAWGPALVAAPPAAVLAAAIGVVWGFGWLICQLVCQSCRGAAWFIKTETLSVQQMRPHKVDEGALEAACAQAGRELAKLQGTEAPDDHFEAEMRAREDHAMKMELMLRYRASQGEEPIVVTNNRTWPRDHCGPKGQYYDANNDPITVPGPVYDPITSSWVWYR